MSTSSRSVDPLDPATLHDGPASASTSSASLPPTGTELGRYVVLGTLGSGGMGVVLRAYDPRLQREVALKRLRSGTLDEVAAERMVREAQAMAQLSHPNVVAVHDVERNESTVLLVMELVEGHTLGRYLRQHQPAWPRILALFVQAGRGLAAAHRAGLVHRDFKPDNVLVGDDGRVRVTDFGLARPVGGDRAAIERSSSASHRMVSSPASSSSTHDSLRMVVTEAGKVMGTPAYMAPEQHLGKEADAKADQFALCVSLWEALCGERPYRGEYRDVAKAKTVGPPPWPSKSVVPRRIVDAIERGLAPDPRSRWPSMDELLAVLDRDPARTRLRFITAGAVTVAAVTTVGALMGWWDRDAARCRGAAAHLQGVWDPERRQQVIAAMRGTEVAYADPTLDEVLPRLDAYAQGWVDMHTAACEATTLRGEQSAEVLDLRMACLQRRRDDLDAAAEVLAHADAEVIEGAIPLVATLPGLDRCADLAALRAAVPDPDDPHLAAAVEQARHELARADALTDVGKQAEALAVVDATPAAARSHGPFAAEWQLQRGQVLLDLRRHDEAAQSLTEAYEQGLRVGHTRAAIEALSALAFTLGNRGTESAAALWMARTAVAMAEHWGDPELLAITIVDLGGVLQASARLDEAVQSYERALAIQRSALRASHPAIATTLGNLSVTLHSKGELERGFAVRQEVMALERELFGEAHPRVARSLHAIGLDLHQRGEYEASVDYLGRALELRRALLGPRHPDTAHSLASLGLARSALGRNAEAERDIREAFEILVDTVGAADLEVIDTLNNLALVVEAQGRYDDALALHQRVHEAMAAALGEAHPRAATSASNVASILVRLRRYEEAVPLLERAAAALGAALGPEHPHLAVTRFNLGDALLGLSRPQEAVAQYELALPVIERAFGPEHVYVSYGAIGLGRALLELERRGEALVLLERGLALRSHNGVAEHDRAEAAFALARALGPDDPTRARTLARRARDAYAAAGPGHERSLDEVDAWLARHAE